MARRVEALFSPSFSLRFLSCLCSLVCVQCDVDCRVRHHCDCFLVRARGDQRSALPEPPERGMDAHGCARWTSTLSAREPHTHKQNKTKWPTTQESYSRCRGGHSTDMHNTQEVAGRPATSSRRCFFFESSQVSTSYSELSVPSISRSQPLDISAFACSDRDWAGTGAGTQPRCRKLACGAIELLSMTNIELLSFVACVINLCTWFAKSLKQGHCTSKKKDVRRQGRSEGGGGWRRREGRKSRSIAQGRRAGGGTGKRKEGKQREQ